MYYGHQHLLHLLRMLIVKTLKYFFLILIFFFKFLFFRKIPISLNLLIYLFVIIFWFYHQKKIFFLSRMIKTFLKSWNCNKQKTFLHLDLFRLIPRPEKQQKKQIKPKTGWDTMCTHNLKAHHVEYIHLFPRHHGILNIVVVELLELQPIQQQQKKSTVKVKEQTKQIQLR